MTENTAAQDAPAEAIAQFAEVFNFLHHEREDVRKMAARGISEQSKDNDNLWAFLSSPQYGPRSIDFLLQFLHAGGIHILGDILTILINCAADGTCAEKLVSRHVVRKAMRLLDGLERSALDVALVHSVQEMTLILLNNLTASHITAVDDLLQKEDEDMRGFYLGKLQMFYSRWGCTDGEEDEQKSPNDNGRSTTALEKPSVVSSESRASQTDEAPASSGKKPRDLQRWILHILLNLTRTDDGQELLLEDEDWRTTLTTCLRSHNAVHRLLAVQCYCNCSSQQSKHTLLLKGDAVVVAVERLGGGKEYFPEVQQHLAEFVANIMQSEEGMSVLEAVNAKKYLLSAVTHSNETRNAAVEVLEEDGVAVVPRAVLTPETCTFIEQHVLPFLDDITDAFIAPGSDAID